MNLASGSGLALVVPLAVAVPGGVAVVGVVMPSNPPISLTLSGVSRSASEGIIPVDRLGSGGYKFVCERVDKVNGWYISL